MPSGLCSLPDALASPRDSPSVGRRCGCELARLVCEYTQIVRACQTKAAGGKYSALVG